jgi:hypothetical protein
VRIQSPERGAASVAVSAGRAIQAGHFRSFVAAIDKGGETALGYAELSRLLNAILQIATVIRATDHLGTRCLYWQEVRRKVRVTKRCSCAAQHLPPGWLDEIPGRP